MRGAHARAGFRCGLVAVRPARPHPVARILPYREHKRLGCGRAGRTNLLPVPGVSDSGRKNFGSRVSLSPVRYMHTHNACEALLQDTIRDTEAKCVVQTSCSTSDHNSIGYCVLHRTTHLAQQVRKLVPQHSLRMDHLCFSVNTASGWR
jgi:hypothetical protein